MSKLLITKTTSLDSIRQTVSTLREQKGKEKETLKLIDEALSFGHDFVANLFFEKALTYQHIYMIDNTNKKALSDMEKAVNEAKDFVIKNNLLDTFESMHYIFLGKVADYKGQYKKAINYYKKSGKGFESMAHLSYSMIMAGQIESGYKLAIETYNGLINSPEGKKLQEKDYETWSIWMSGVTIRSVRALLDKKAYPKSNTLNDWLKQVEAWVKDTEKYLNRKDQFSYRRAEIKNLWKKIENYKKK